MTGSSKIIRVYVLREILGTTLLSTVILSIILLYGNLSKHDEALFRALSLSPALFFELIGLMLPFALSLGLPFGFSLAVIFCVGKWSADRELVALQSLGVKQSTWVTPIFLSALLVSSLGCFASLHWSPLSRGAFDSRIREMAWQDFQCWIDEGREIDFKINNEEQSNLMGGLGTGLRNKVTQATLTIGHGDGDSWKNVRILLSGEDRDLLAILHAKSSSVSVDKDQGTVELFLHEVDYESFEETNGGRSRNSSFVSFERWKQPVTFSLGSPNLTRDMKRLSVFEFWRLSKSEAIGEAEMVRAYNHFNKYASICCAPISLCLLLVKVAVRRGRRETYANLFLGVLICLLFFSLGTGMGQSLSSQGYGWWISNTISLGMGFLPWSKKIK